VHAIRHGVKRMECERRVWPHMNDELTGPNGELLALHGYMEHDAQRLDCDKLVLLRMVLSMNGNVFHAFPLLIPPHLWLIFHRIIFSATSALIADTKIASNTIPQKSFMFKI